MSTTRSMVQGVEVWAPQGEVMRLDGSAFALHEQFAKASAASVFRRGEGLPGAVWATSRALHWRQLSVHFLHSELATSSGIDAAIGVPIFRGSEFVAALVFYLTDAAFSGGCVELWNLDEARGVLRHSGGHYVECSDLERLSLLLQFQRGVGLPGQAWGSGSAVLMPDVSRASGFIRSSLAAQFALECGFGMPLSDGAGVNGALTFIARASDPFLRSAEIWRAHPGELQLVAAKGSGMPIETTVVMGDMLVGRAAQSGKPLVVNGSAGASPSALITLALPIHDAEGQLLSVACLKF